MKLKISNLISGRGEVPVKELNAPTASNSTVPQQQDCSSKDENVNTSSSVCSETPILSSGASEVQLGLAPSAPQHRKSATGAPGRRPSAAAPRVDKKERMAALMARNPTTWSVKEVCDWLEAVGLGKHRKAFVHHSLSGALLPKISAERLKEDLGLKSLGQRETLLSSIQELLAQSRAREESISGSVLLSATAIPPSPAPAAVVPVPGSELLKAQEQCARQKREHEKAEARAVQLQAAAEQAQRVSDLAQREVLRLQDAVRKAELQCAPLRGKAAILAGVVPSPKPGTEKSTKEKSQAASAEFMQRLQSDMAARKAKLRRGGRAQAGRMRSQSDKESDTLASCLDIIRAEVGDKDPGLKLSLKPDEQEDRLIAALHDAASALSEKLSAGDVIAVKAAVGPEKKAQRLASGIKTALFMRRLEQDLSTRDERKKELRQRWAAQRAERAAAKEGRDMREARTRFRAMGWPDVVEGGESAWNELLSGLLNRGRIAGKAKADNKAPDWEQCRSDGLLAYGLSEDLNSNTSPTATTDPGLADVSLTAGAGAASTTSLQPPAAGNSLLASTVEMLGCCRGEELDRLLTVSGAKRVLAVHRALKTQEFLKETKADLDARAAKREDTQTSGKPVRGKKLQKEAQTAFLERLAEDAAKRARSREELQAKALEAEKAASTPVKGPSVKRTRSKDAGDAKTGE